MKITTRAGNGFWNKQWAAWSRWLHLYLSMISFAILFFFAVTGLTLNHTEWFEGQQKSVTKKGKLETAWVNASDTSKIDKLKVVEYFRSNLQVRGSLSDFIIDEAQCTVAFSGPGYSADIFIERVSGKYDITETYSGFVAVINDLHKGRDSGVVWKWLIDISAVLMILVSVTGLMMLIFLKKRRMAGFLTGLAGLLIAYLVYKFFVP
jgi:hypothetical protein